MKIPVTYFIAWRYLISKRKTRFINIIGYISIVGITIGVAALLTALSVFNGFSGVVTSVLVGFDPHIRIEKKGGISEDDYSLVEKELNSLSEIEAFSPYVSGKAMLTTGAYNKVVFINGVDWNKIESVSGLGNRMILGSLKAQQANRSNGIIIGLTLADRLSAVLENEVTLYSPDNVQTALTGIGMPQGSRFVVKGIYESYNREYDANYAYTDISTAQEIFRAEGKYHGIEIRLDDFKKSEKIKSELQKILPAGYIIQTWYDLHRSLYSVMEIERWTAYILLSLIIVVATFNMLGSLTMGVIEKQRDISVLKAMGLTTKNITRLFMFEGMLIGIIGTVIGIILGLIVLYLQIRFQFFPLDSSIYIIPAIPVEIHLSDFIAIAFASLGLSAVASYYPARRAASILPAEGIRWE